MTMKTFERFFFPFLFFLLSLKLLMADYSSRPTSPKATEGSGLMKNEVVLLHVAGIPGLDSDNFFVPFNVDK